MLVPVEPIKVDIPHEPGQWVEFRKLSWKQLKDARKARASEQREEAKALGAEFVTALTSGNREDEDKVRKRINELQYDVTNFDQEVLLTKGIAAWSYTAADGTPVQVVDGIPQLDEATAVWAAKTVIDLSRPPSEAEEKNG